MLIYGAGYEAGKTTLGTRDGIITERRIKRVLPGNDTSTASGCHPACLAAPFIGPAHILIPPVGLFVALAAVAGNLAMRRGPGPQKRK
jgi:hypothetical protein